MRTGQSIIVQDRGATLAHWSLLPAHDSPQGWRTLALFHSTFNLLGLQSSPILILSDNTEDWEGKME